jgi:hypothetical protein
MQKRKSKETTVPRKGGRDAAIRKHITALLASSEAHLGFEEIVSSLPPGMEGIRPPGAAHTPWQLLEHLRICQWDILEFSRNPGHRSPSSQQGYWPASEAPPDEAAWERSLDAFRADLRAMKKLVADPRRNLLARIDHPDARSKHTLLREALLLADHNAYHLGQLVLLRRLLEVWPPGEPAAS